MVFPNFERPLFSPTLAYIGHLRSEREHLKINESIVPSSFFLRFSVIQRATTRLLDLAMSFNNPNLPREGGNVWSAGSRGEMSNFSLSTTPLTHFSQVRVEVSFTQIVMTMVPEEGKHTG